MHVGRCGEVPQGITGSLRRAFHIVSEADEAECLQIEVPRCLTRTSSSAFFKAAICEILSEEGSDNRGLSGFNSQKFMVSMNVSGSTRARDVEYGLMCLKEGGQGKVWPYQMVHVDGVRWRSLCFVDPQKLGRVHVRKPR
jgi:hypothetical protein